MVEFPGLHAWSKKLEVLEPEVLLRLFQEAVDLPAKVSQDPRWYYRGLPERDVAHAVMHRRAISARQEGQR